MNFCISLGNYENLYLWPIPSKEVLINDNLTQNPNY